MQYPAVCHPDEAVQPMSLKVCLCKDLPVPESSHVFLEFCCSYGPVYGVLLLLPC